MNKITKGAIATAAGVILLMGGAGTLASWNSTATAGAQQTIASGSLAVNTPGAGVWKNAAGTTVTPSSYKIVPGDVLTFTQTFNLAATGDNLKFTVSATPGTINPTTAGKAEDIALAGLLTSSATFAIPTTGQNVSLVSGSTYAVASNSGSSTITVTMTLTFPQTATTGQLGSINLGAGAITLQQV